MVLPELRRQRPLVQENARLKRLLAERDLEVDALRELLAKKSCRWPTAGRRSPSCEGGGSPSGEPADCCTSAGPACDTARARTGTRPSAPAAAGLGPTAPPSRLSTGLGGAPARGLDPQRQAG